jgi:hypothetical protein
VIESLPEDSEARQEAIALAFQLEQADDEELDRGVLNLREYRTSGRYMRRHEVPPDGETPAPEPIEDLAELLKRVIAKINAGEAKDDDPEIMLYKEHMVRAHGSGGREVD